MSYNFSNFATSAVLGGAAGVGSTFQIGDTTFYLNAGDGAKFPAAPFSLVVGGDTANPEILLCTAIVGDQLTVLRHQESTAERGWNPGSLVQHTITAGAMNDTVAAANAVSDFPVTNGGASTITLSGVGGASETIDIATTAASSAITLRANGAVYVIDPATATTRHTFSGTGNATHTGTLTVNSSASLDNGKTVSDGSGLLTTTLAVSNKHTYLGYLSAVPVATQGVIGVRVTGDTVSRVSLGVRTDGYGTVNLGVGGASAATAQLYGASDGLHVTGSALTLSGALSVFSTLSTDSGLITTDGAGQLTSAFSTNTRIPFSVSYTSAPASDVSTLQVKITGDTSQRARLYLRSTGYGALGLSNGGASYNAILEGVSGGLSVTAATAAFSTAVTVGSTLQTGGQLTVSSGGLTVTAGGLTVTAGATSLDGAKMVSDGSGQMSYLLAVNTKPALITQLSATPAGDQPVVGVRVNGDTSYRAALHLNAAGYGGLQVGTGTAITATIAGESTGVRISATALSLSGAINASGAVSASDFQLKSGTQETGICGSSFHGSAANLTALFASPFRSTMTNTPSSVTLNTGAPIDNTNANSPGAQNMSVYGFVIAFKNTAIGLARYIVNYTTVGNCLYAVNTTAQTIDWHCDGCDAMYYGTPFGAVQVSEHPELGTSCPGQFGLGLVCPTCGAMECFNTGMTTEDERPEDPHDSRVTSRWSQARLIRRLQQALGHPVK